MHTAGLNKQPPEIKFNIHNTDIYTLKKARIAIIERHNHSK